MGMGMVVYIYGIHVCVRAHKSALFLIDLPDMHGYPRSVYVMVCVCDSVCVCVCV